MPGTLSQVPWSGSVPVGGRLPGISSVSSSSPSSDAEPPSKKGHVWAKPCWLLSPAHKCFCWDIHPVREVRGKGHFSLGFLSASKDSLVATQAQPTSASRVGPILLRSAPRRLPEAILAQTSRKSSIIIQPGQRRPPQKKAMTFIIGKLVLSLADAAWIRKNAAQGRSPTSCFLAMFRATLLVGQRKYTSMSVLMYNKLRFLMKRTFHMGNPNANQTPLLLAMLAGSTAVGRTHLQGWRATLFSGQSSAR